MGSIILWAIIRELSASIVIQMVFRVEGYSYNYFVMNFSGYLLYTLYMSIGYFTTIKGAGTVVIADLLFVYHAMFMMILYSIQFLMYPVIYI